MNVANNQQSGGNPVKATWTAEQDTWLASLAEQGLTALQAAPILGVTRNAVLGRAHRTGVKFKNRVVAKFKAPRQPRAARARNEPRASRRKIAKDAIDLARSLYLKGETYAKISEATGIFAGGLSVYFSDLPRRRPVTWDVRRRSRSFRLEALALCLVSSYRKAAKAMNCSEASIQNWRGDEALYLEARAIADRIKEERLRAAAEAKVRADLARLDLLAAITKNNAPILPLLTARQRLIVERRIAGQSLQEIGDALGVTRERIRQIEGRCRALGIMLPGVGPLSEAALSTFGLKPQPPRKSSAERRPPAAPGERRPYRMSEAERQRRSERMREMWASR